MKRDERSTRNSASRSCHWESLETRALLSATLPMGALHSSHAPAPQVAALHASAMRAAASTVRANFSGIAAGDFGEVHGPVSVDDTVDLGEPDKDYTFTLTNEGDFHADLSGLTGDATMAVFDDNGDIVADDVGDGFIDVHLGAGDYTLEVSLDETTSDVAGYTLTLSHEVGGPTQGEATFLGRLGRTEDVTDFVDADDHADWYAFSVRSRRKTGVEISLDNLQDDATVSLVSARGRVLASDSSDGADNADLIVGLRRGTYWVLVTPDTDSRTEYDLSINPVSLHGFVARPASVPATPFASMLIQNTADGRSLKDLFA